MPPEFKFVPSSLDENKVLVDEYLKSLAAPMDSYVEDNIVSCQIQSIVADGVPCGFFGSQGETLWVFYVTKPMLRYAQAIFTDACQNSELTEVFFQTSDPLMVGLVMDWEFEKKKGAYFFVDGGHIARPELSFCDVTFTQATLGDFEEIQQKTNNFFSADDLNNGTIFMLRSGSDLLGCGIGVRGKFFKDYVSIGMVTCKPYRRMGVGKFILWSLKEWCYEQGLKPAAGCWYYNTLSKKSLESVGLVSLARGMRAKLTGKETIPERTGNPPGEPTT